MNDQNYYKNIWKYFVDTSYETGEIIDEEKKKKQAAYSLYTAFYEKNNEYSELKSDLIGGFFGEKKLPFINKEKVGDEIKKQFGENANACIEGKPVNSDQLQAIKNGLIQPVTLVQGPPGTGKTEMILNFLAVITELSPDSKVAVVSCNSEALSNINDALDERKTKAIDNGDPENIMVKVCDRRAKLGNKEKRREWSQRVDREFIGSDTDSIFKFKLLERYPIFTSTIHSLPKIFSKYPDLFDYVIIDECSQVSVSLGLVAMAFAKRLMLVGDDLQLRAIIDERAIANTKKRDEAERKYLEQSDKSFLNACETLFPNAPKIMLKDHYRCHPSIGNFCNKYVYEGELNVKTDTPGEEKDDLRIGIIYYDGEFMESQKSQQKDRQKDGRTLTEKNRREYEKNKKPLDPPQANEKTPSQRCNYRQIGIFLEECLPLLKDKIESARRAEKPLSICVLAPFRCQLEVLRDELNKLDEFKNLLEEIEIDSDPNSDEKKQKTDNENDLQSLSIHKAQGRGYDIVYLMTVEDNHNNGGAPWGQKMRTINVAVSRAKKELYVFTSRIWIPRYIQKELPDFKTTAPLPSCLDERLSNRKDEDEEAFYDRVFAKCTEKDESKENFYIGRLCKWIYDTWGVKEHNNKYGKFGFRKAATICAFDVFTNGADHHEIIKNALLANRPDLSKDDIKTHASLSEAPELVEKLKALRDNVDFKEKTLGDADFAVRDFIFICKDNRIKVIVHILDKNYRNACLEKYGFFLRLKDCIKQTRGKNKYIAIPTNGIPGCEVEKILEKYDQSRDDLFFEENHVIMLLKSRTAECLDVVSETLYIHGEFKLVPPLSEENAKIYEALKLNYSNAKDVKYELLTQQYYLCRCGTAYAFEYALMYDIVFGSSKAARFDILSLGCGSCIDALAAEYSRERLGENRPLSYRGVDREKWAVGFLDEIGKYFDNKPEAVELNDIVEYFKAPENRLIGSNVIFFPKILNELSDEALEELLSAAQNCSLDTDVDEFYFCISHAKKSAEKYSGYAKRFIKALGNSGQYTDVSVSSFFKDDGFGSRWGLKDKNLLVEESGICSFNREENVNKLNPDFSDTRTDGIMTGIVKNLKKTDKEKAEEMFRHRIKTVREIAFQVIKLEKKK